MFEEKVRFRDKVYNPKEERTAENELILGEAISVSQIPGRVFLTLIIFTILIGPWLFFYSPMNYVYTAIALFIYLIWCYLGRKYQFVDYDEEKAGERGVESMFNAELHNDDARAMLYWDPLTRVGNYFAISWILLFSLLFKRHHFKEEATVENPKYDIEF